MQIIFFFNFAVLVHNFVGLTVFQVFMGQSEFIVFTFVSAKYTGTLASTLVSEFIVVTFVSVKYTGTLASTLVS